MLCMRLLLRSVVMLFLVVGMYRFAMVKCLFLFVWIMTSCSYVLCVLMFLEISTWVNVTLCLIFGSSPAPNFTSLYVRMGV